jgi:diguanylate cyclase (GGDEF)-like protein
MTFDAAHRAAHVRAYDLLQAVQGDDRPATLRALPAAIADANEHNWSDVAFLLAAAQTVDVVSHCTDSTQTQAAVAALVEHATELGSPALQAIALGLRAVAAAATGETADLIADAARAVALLDDEDQSALDRSVGYVIAGAAFNSLRLWELVDEFYGRALEFGPESRASHQTAAVAINRVLVRLEWALSAVEFGDDERATDLLTRVLEAVPAALAEPMPELWHCDVRTCADVASLLLGGCEVDTYLSRLDEHRRSLLDCADIEALPALEAATVLALWQSGQREAALAGVGGLMSTVPSASSGARSFPLWVRAKVLAEADPSAATAAQLDHSRELGRLVRQSRLSVLAAARAQIHIERRRREHEALSRAVETDALTGLRNRRMFEAWLREPSRDAGLSTALMLIDIDDFKEVNDTFGHDCGDQVLRMVADLMASAIRAGDVAIRHGGDEFALLIEGEQLLDSTVLERADQLSAAIAAAPWSQVATGLAVSVSIGVGLSAFASAAELYKIADAALYRAKRNGSRIALAQV